MKLTAVSSFTGWIIGWDKTTGNLVEHFATEGLGVDSQTKGGGVWMSGGGISSDNAGSIFFATGNGYASQLSTIPVNGHNPPTALEEAAVHMTINDDGSLTIVDFFMPWEKTQLDGADRDLGTSPLELLPPEFSCGDIRRIGVVTGKSGKTYWLNLDNLGGYQNGPNKLDANIQTYQNENSVRYLAFSREFWTNRHPRFMQAQEFTLVKEVISISTVRESAQC